MNNILEEIQKLDDNELLKYINKRVKYLEENSDKEDTIGFCLDYNPKEYYLTEKEHNDIVIEVTTTFSGFIKRGVKVVYGSATDHNLISSNYGYYYYIDNHDYLYSFLMYIKSVEPESTIDLFDYIQYFINSYFWGIEDVDRDQMLSMIAKDNIRFYDPINEHKYSSFKRKGNALCTERSVMAQNILAFLGYEIYLVYGKEEDIDDNYYEEDLNILHAFNFIAFKKEEDEEKKMYLIDFSKSVEVVDINNNLNYYRPFLEEIGDIDIDNMVVNKEILTFSEYDYVIMNNTMMKWSLGSERQYSFNDYCPLEEEKKVSILEKVKKY